MDNAPLFVDNLCFFTLLLPVYAILCIDLSFLHNISMCFYSGNYLWRFWALIMSWAPVIVRPCIKPIPNPNPTYFNENKALSKCVQSLYLITRFNCMRSRMKLCWNIILYIYIYMYMCVVWFLVSCVLFFDVLFLTFLFW